MLKFLENRPQDQSPKRSPIKYQPEMCYGNSYESPKQFQTPFTIYHRTSYLNPFLPYEQKRARAVSVKDKTVLQPVWTHKTNLTMVEEHKILAKPEQKPPTSRYLQSFYKQFDSNPKRFMITRGEFTNFIEKNNHYKSMGPMQGIQRNNQRIKARQQSVWIKSPSKRDEMTSSLRYASCLNTTVKSSIGENSQMLTEKVRIRRNRDHIRKMFRQNLQERKKLNTSEKFQLSKKGPSHEIFLVDDGLNARYTGVSPSKANNLEQLDDFENKLYKHFK